MHKKFHCWLKIQNAAVNQPTYWQRTSQKKVCNTLPNKNIRSLHASQIRTAPNLAIPPGFQLTGKTPKLIQADAVHKPIRIICTWFLHWSERVSKKSRQHVHRRTRVLIRLTVINRPSGVTPYKFIDRKDIETSNRSRSSADSYNLYAISALNACR